MSHLIYIFRDLKGINSFGVFIKIKLLNIDTIAPFPTTDFTSQRFLDSDTHAPTCGYIL